MLFRSLYHWTHLELSRHFGIDTLLNEETAEEIWEETTAKLAQPELSVHGILKQFDVRALCTTDDPTESLDQHEAIAALGIRTKVYPTFRPDKAWSVDQPEFFNAWADKLAGAADGDTSTLAGFLAALEKRVEDFHAIGSAHNLLSAMLDNHIYWGNALGIDARRISWRRVVDLNDRALRTITGSLGGVANGFPREDHFDITVASEVMAIFCLANDLADLGARLADITVGETRGREPVTARQLEASGSMTVLLNDGIGRASLWGSGYIPVVALSLKKK